MKYNIAVLKGDGIGPEVIDQAIKVISRKTKKKITNELKLLYGKRIT